MHYYGAAAHFSLQYLLLFAWDNVCLFALGLRSFFKTMSTFRELHISQPILCAWIVVYSTFSYDDEHKFLPSH